MVARRHASGPSLARLTLRLTGDERAAIDAQAASMGLDAVGLTRAWISAGCPMPPSTATATACAVEVVAPVLAATMGPGPTVAPAACPAMVTAQALDGRLVAAVATLAEGLPAGAPGVPLPALRLALQDVARVDLDAELVRLHRARRVLLRLAPAVAVDLEHGIATPAGTLYFAALP